MNVLRSTVGNGINSSPNDVKILRSTLNDLGYKDYNLDFEFVDAQLDKNIKKFQKDNNLKIDGVVKPDGETLDKIGEIAVRLPTMWCKKCGGPHGGSKGSICDSCSSK